MKKKLLLFPLLVLVLILTLLPVRFLSANPGNLAVNGDFSSPLSTGWGDTSGGGGSASINAGGQLVLDTLSGGNAEIDQGINTSQQNLTFKFDINPSSYSPGSYIYYCVQFFKSGPQVGFCNWSGSSIPTGTWTSISKYLPQWYADLNGGASIPDYDAIHIWLETSSGCSALLDNVWLGTEANAPYVTPAVPAWVRGDQQMMCKRVWVNEEGNFQFSFIYPYADNNWVKIYDMSGKEVFSVDMPYDNPNLIVDLPDGMYTVKTFTVGNTEPIQTFLIGKP
jgi:hypothetical protein